MFPDNNMFKLRGFSKLQCCPIVCHVIFFAILSMHTINSGESVKICILNFKQTIFIIFFTYSQPLSCLQEKKNLVHNFIAPQEI